jgi:hypothetical protein
VEEAGVALQVVSMEELKLEVLLEPERTGASVAEVCRRRGIARASDYRYRRRYLDEVAREAVALAARTDFLNLHGDALACLARVSGDAQAHDEARALYERKGNVAALTLL